ncbi:DNA gyrase inhibitor YacG [Acetobacteraceae bacterium H6797]|nr:DNA gyrase inhibitor YacG [Acetobacteraceae bacterium H6797]
MTPEKPARPAPKCPVCGRPSVAEAKPFCSDRCRQVDLGRWLTESYVVPGPPPGNDDDAED